MEIGMATGTTVNNVGLYRHTGRMVVGILLTVYAGKLKPIARFKADIGITDVGLKDVKFVGRLLANIKPGKFTSPGFLSSHPRSHSSV